jgi:hypothetical protein
LIDWKNGTFWNRLKFIHEELANIAVPRKEMQDAVEKIVKFVEEWWASPSR